MLQAAQQLHRVFLIGFRLSGILADDVERIELAAFHRLEHIREIPPSSAGQLAFHACSNLAMLSRIFDVLATGKLVRDRAHVAAALNVVLTSQRIDSRAVTSDVTAEQREIDERTHVVDGVVMFGDSERPTELGALGKRVCVGELADERGRDAGCFLRLHQRVRFDAFTILVEAARRSRNELAILQAGR